MRVVICTSLYPPDVGGPATHARDLREYLATRGHSVTVLTLGEQTRFNGPGQRVQIRRSLPWPTWFIAVMLWLLRHRRRYDVIYATGLQGPAVLAARLAHKPVVVKVVGDPAWERGRRLGMVAETFDDFQREPAGSMQVALGRRFRDWWVRNATAVNVPSEFLRRVVLQW